MSPPTKAFDEQLYKQWDLRAREVVKRHFKNLHLIDNPDRYGIDLIASGRGLGFEVEVKKGWHSFRFPFRTLHFPKRKSKWANSSNFFVVVNSPMTRIAIVRGNILQETITKDTIYTEDEEFFEVPLSKVIFQAISE